MADDKPPMLQSVLLRIRFQSTGNTLELYASSRYLIPTDELRRFAEALDAAFLPNRAAENEARRRLTAKLDADLAELGRKHALLTAEVKALQKLARTMGQDDGAPAPAKPAAQVASFAYRAATLGITKRTILETLVAHNGAANRADLVCIDGSAGQRHVGPAPARRHRHGRQRQVEHHRRRAKVAGRGQGEVGRQQGGRQCFRDVA